jgi:hypothetical protein
MRSAIKEKMKKFLTDKDSISESDIVYILVQLSKYYEREKVEDIITNTAIPCIKFFRNWVVHGTIDRKSTYVNIVLTKHKELGPDHLYQQLYKDLLVEINNTGLIIIPPESEEAFKRNLFEVIKDVPVIVAVEKEKLVANDYDKINLESL